MNLTEKPEVVAWPETHYVFLEKVGPIPENAPKAWQELLATLPPKDDRCIGMMSMFKVDPNPIYRAGAILKTKPEGQLPKGLKYEKVKGGKYSKFTLTGSYADLPIAMGKVFEIVHKTKIPQRDDFCIEHYTNDPQSTPEDKLVTEILIPTR